MQTWELWYPEAGATGLLFARGKMDPTTELWVHAAPNVLAVTVRDDAEQIIANHDGLGRQGEAFPMTHLILRRGHLTREDRWPLPADLGGPVILHGGEVGLLQTWWNAPDGSEWRWQLEFYNRR